MSRGDELLPLPFVRIKASTDGIEGKGALLVLFSEMPEQERWIPKSLVHNVNTCRDEKMLIMTRWAVDKKKLRPFVKKGYE